MDKLYHLLVYIASKQEREWKSVLCGPSFELACPISVKFRRQIREIWERGFCSSSSHKYTTRKTTISLPIYYYSHADTSKTFWNSIRTLTGLKMNAFCIVSFLIFIRFLFFCVLSSTRIDMRVCDSTPLHALTRYFPI